MDALPHDLLMHGRTALAYSVVGDPAVQSFRAREGTVLFGRVWTPGGKRTVVASDPLCPDAALPRVLGELVEAFPDAAFFQVTAKVTEALAAFGYERTHLAVERTVLLQDWSKSGEKQQCLRTAYNRALRDGHEIVEARAEDVGIDELERISEAWMQTKRLRHRAISFFARPAIYEHEPAVRKFFALRNGVPTAFVVFDPMFENGREVGYVAMTLRQDPAESPGLCDAVIVHAAEQFKREGLRELHLGMSPFCPPRDPQATQGEPGVASLLVTMNWSLLNVLFNYQGIAGHKRRWRARESAVYYAGKPGRAFFDFFAAARITGIL